MAAPSELAALLRVGTDAELSGYAARSHLSDGRIVAWTGPAGPGHPAVAIDAELDRPVPAALAARFGVEAFWERWTRLECLAKLTDTPVLLLQAEGLDPDLPPGAEVTTLRIEGGHVVVSVGTLPSPVT